MSLSSVGQESLIPLWLARPSSKISQEHLPKPASDISHLNASPRPANWPNSFPPNGLSVDASLGLEFLSPRTAYERLQNYRLGNWLKMSPPQRPSLVTDSDSAASSPPPHQLDCSNLFHFLTALTAVGIWFLNLLSVPGALPKEDGHREGRDCACLVHNHSPGT